MMLSDSVSLRYPVKCEVELLISLTRFFAIFVEISYNYFNNLFRISKDFPIFSKN